MNDYHYDDEKLNGLAIADLIASEWGSGRYATIAEVTSAVHGVNAELPRSVVFWLAYHTLQHSPEQRNPAAAKAQAWPVR